MLVGQAPGVTEVTTRLPFTGPAGKRLDGWFARAGVRREDVYFSALARCFPGKAKGGGDKAPSRAMVRNCKRHLDWEFREMRPEVVILVGGLAIREVLGIKTLSESAGKLYRRGNGDGVVYVPLPHPSGASTWLNSPENREKLEDSLLALGQLMSGGEPDRGRTETLKEDR